MQNIKRLILLLAISSFGCINIDTSGNALSDFNAARIVWENHCIQSLAQTGKFSRGAETTEFCVRDIEQARERDYLLAVLHDKFTFNRAGEDDHRLKFFIINGVTVCNEINKHTKLTYNYCRQITDAYTSLFVDNIKKEYQL